MDAPTTGTASDYFGAMVSEYTDLMRRALPRYDDMIATLMRFMPERPSHILELGCGTGNLTLLLAQRWPDVQLTTVDASQEMIDATRARLADVSPEFAQRTTYLCGRFEELSIEDKSFDLVTSCISLHHVVNKAPMFANIYRWLAPGGALCFADQFRGSTDENHEKIWTDWKAYTLEPGHCTPEELQSLLDHAEAHDHYEPMLAHRQYLESAGFSPERIDFVWRHLLWTVTTADRPD